MSSAQGHFDDPRLKQITIKSTATRYACASFWCYAIKSISLCTSFPQTSHPSRFGNIGDCGRANNSRYGPSDICSMRFMKISGFSLCSRRGSEYHVPFAVVMNDCRCASDSSSNFPLTRHTGVSQPHFLIPRARPPHISQVGFTDDQPRLATIKCSVFPLNPPPRPGPGLHHVSNVSGVKPHASTTSYASRIMGNTDHK